jgi:hypothetical protein
VRVRLTRNIQGAICSCLTLKRHFFVRFSKIPATFGDRRTKQLRVRKFGKYAMPGLADIRRQGRPGLFGSEG